MSIVERNCVARRTREDNRFQTSLAEPQIAAFVRLGGGSVQRGIRLAADVIGSVDPDTCELTRDELLKLREIRDRARELLVERKHSRSASELDRAFQSLETALKAQEVRRVH